MRAVDIRIAPRRIRRKLTMDDIAERHAVPLGKAQELMSACHGLNAAFERFDELVHRSATVARAHGYDRNTRKYILDAMVELAHEQLYVLLGLPALGNVERNTKKMCWLAVRIMQNDLGGPEVVRGSVTRPDRLFGDVAYLVAGKNFPIDAREEIRLLLGKEIVVILADQVAT